MGPILRRKKVVSMPLGDPRRNDFFYGGDRRGVPINHNIDETTSATDDGISNLPDIHSTANERARHRARQNTAPSARAAPGGFFQVDATVGSPPSGRPRRKKTNSFLGGVLTRRAVGLDLLPAEEADLQVYENFFQPRLETVDTGAAPVLPSGLDRGEETKEETEENLLEDGTKGRAVSGEGAQEVKEVTPEEAPKPKRKLFKPLVFAPRVIPKGGGGGHGHGGGGHGGGGHGHAAAPVSHEKTSPAKEKTDRTVADVSSHSNGTAGDLATISEAIPVASATGSPPSPRKNGDDKDVDTSDDFHDDESMDLIEKFDDSHIIRATRKDYYYTGFLGCVMCALVGTFIIVSFGNLVRVECEF